MLGMLAGIGMGVTIWKHAGSALHEIEGLLCFVVAAVCLVGVALATIMEHWGALHAKHLLELRSAHAQAANSTIAVLGTRT